MCAAPYIRYSSFIGMAATAGCVRAVRWTLSVSRVRIIRPYVYKRDVVGALARVVVYLCGRAGATVGGPPPSLQPALRIRRKTAAARPVLVPVGWCVHRAVTLYR